MRIVLFISLCILIALQVSHIRNDFGALINPGLATLTAAAFVIAINVSYSATFDHIKAGAVTSGKGSLAIIVVIILTLFASWISVNASIRAFAKTKHQTVMNEEAGPAAMAYRNKMVRADVRLNELAKNGVTSGPEYDQLTREVLQGAEAYKAELGGKVQQSAYAKALTGGDENSEVDSEVRSQSILQAIGLEGLCAALSILLGIGTPLSQSIERSLGAQPKPKKQYGSSHP